MIVNRRLRLAGRKTRVNRLPRCRINPLIPRKTPRNQSLRRSRRHHYLGADRRSESPVCVWGFGTTGCVSFRCRQKAAAAMQEAFLEDMASSPSGALIAQPLCDVQPPLLGGRCAIVVHTESHAIATRIVGINRWPPALYLGRSLKMQFGRVSRAFASSSDIMKRAPRPYSNAVSKQLSGRRDLLSCIVMAQ